MTLSDAPMIRQAPISVALILVLVVAAIDGGFVESTNAAYWATWATLGIAVAVSILASAVHSTALGIAVPFISMVAIAFGRAAIGPTVTLLLLLCVLWIALLPGRRWVVISGLSTLAAVALSYVWPTTVIDPTHVVMELVITPLMFSTIAAVINRVIEDNKARMESNELLVRQREEALADAVDLVSRLRENEAQLESAGYLFRSVLDSVTRQSVIGTDLSGLIDVWNTGAQTMLGLNAADVVGNRYIHEFHRDEELHERARELGYPAGATVLNPGFSALVEVARLGGSEDRDWTYLRANGDEVFAHVAVTPRIDENGRTVGYIFVGADVTDKKELAKLQDEFVGLVSHELRTPVSSILGYLELMRDATEPPLSDEQLQYLGVAERNAHRLLRLVGDLLFTAQVAAHKFPIEAAEVDLNGVVQASVESARPASQTANVLLLLRPADSHPVVWGDATRIAQACDNLLSNAIKFTPRGGTVSVNVSIEGEFARIAIRDTGMGIPPDEIAMLSTRFFRASTATRSAVQGVGLGLSITKAIVTAHGGELSAESEVGVGTTFTFTLPLRGRAA
ncbi:sensor histidine kinase [Salinibacterium hongtaonis]|uniref:histidine kinase n=1 Tax=Homoserinimonas hongtaonis TaxID=2079791 RepID=A0A2U1SWX2_9MICO|nr:ATP-binding protein [Salinibacterium hongtaonis]AWB88717.1 PAS domain-containing sensor histidine kinase [Salinibacterium hongtaonis]PWB96127.1 PAS domain-containing protein [Salinibacterium hongtaonis]